MSNATSAATIRPDEAAHFGKLAAEWWDSKGSSAMLHRLNPVRLGFVREAADRHFGGDPATLKPLAGKRALDVGCGAGLLAEPLARLGAAVTGVDAAAENIAAAQAHAAGSGLLIDYRAGELAGLSLGQFDLVTCMEVLEHVADKPAFVDGLAASLAPGGLLILSTPNRTAWSRLLTITLAEGFGKIPRGTHHYDEFITPDEMTAMLAEAGLVVDDIEGIAMSPVRGLHLSEDVRLNYLVAARGAAEPR